MRNALKPLENIRFTFIATFEKYGTCIISGNPYKTALLRNIKNTFGDNICDHVWIREVWKIDKLHLKKGDIIKFSAKVAKYKHGYYLANGDSDYKLIYLKNIRKILEKDYNISYNYHNKNKECEKICKK